MEETHSHRETKNNNIIQWNVNSYFSRLTNLQRLIKERQPQTLALQETNFKNDFCADIRGYSSTFKNRSSKHASGGVAIFIKNDINFTELVLNTSLEATAITCYIPRKICICNIYLPNSQTLTLEDLENLKKQLPKPFIILGDFNSHNPLWGLKNLA